MARCGSWSRARGTLTVANTGQVPVQFEFIRKLNDLSICKPWLTVEPSSGFIMPGEKADVSLEVMVDKRTAGALNCGKDQLYDILVLHLVGGKDIFVTVSGEYRRSCFGASIDALCKMTVPISELSVSTLMEYEGTKACASTEELKEKSEENEPYPVPKELWFLCDLITSLGLHQENLFLQPGLRAEVLSIRDWLDTGLPAREPACVCALPPQSPSSSSSSPLREPIVPFSSYQRCLEAAPNYLQCRQAASALPSRHRQVFRVRRRLPARGVCALGAQRRRPKDLGHALLGRLPEGTRRARISARASGRARNSSYWTRKRLDSSITL